MKWLQTLSMFWLKLKLFQTCLTQRNDELQQCHMHIQISANPEYSSLNLAAAVQVIAYELRVASLGEQRIKKS